jgi:hypothetical protein
MHVYQVQWYYDSQGIPRDISTLGYFLEHPELIHAYFLKQFEVSIPE